MKKKIALFDAKPYDIEFFNEANMSFNFDITFFEAKLKARTAKLAVDFDGVCAFVNDAIDSTVIEQLCKQRVKERTGRRNE